MAAQASSATVLIDILVVGRCSNQQRIAVERSVESKIVVLGANEVQMRLS